MLHSLGDDALRVYNGFKFDKPEADRTVKDIIEHFDTYAIGEVNETYERFKFHRRNQQAGETFEMYLATLRNLLQTCNFCPTCKDSVLRDRIVLGIQQSTVQTALLRERNLTLSKCIDLCKACENATHRHQAIKTDPVHKLSASRSQSGGKQGQSRQQVSGATASHYSKQSPPSKACHFCCPYTHPLREELCPAFGKTCKSVGRKITLPSSVLPGVIR